MRLLGGLGPFIPTLAGLSTRLGCATQPVGEFRTTPISTMLCHVLSLKKMLVTGPALPLQLFIRICTTGLVLY